MYELFEYYDCGINIASKSQPAHKQCALFKSNCIQYNNNLLILKKETQLPAFDK